MKFKFVFALAAVAIAASFMPTTAHAALNLTLNNPNPGISAYPGPYGTATIDVTTSTTATVLFSNLSNGPYTYLFGGQGAVALNLNASTYTVGPITFTGGNGNTALSSAGPGNEDGWGSFNLTIDGFDGFSSAVTSASFTVTNTSGTWVLDESNVLTPNASGYLAAAHIFVAGTGLPNAPTGFTTNGSHSAPEPTAFAIWGGLGLIGSAVAAFRRRKSA